MKMPVFLEMAISKQPIRKAVFLDLTLIGKENFNTLMGLIPPDSAIKLEQTNPNSTTNTVFRFQGLSGPKGQCQN